MTKTKSRILEAVHESARDLHRLGCGSAGVITCNSMACVWQAGVLG